VTEREGRKDETGRRVEKGQGRGSPRAGGGRSTEMINASRSPPFVPFPRSTTYPRPPLPPSRLPTYLPPRPRSVALSKFSTGVRENALARPYNAPNALRGRNSLPPPPPPCTFRPGEKEIYIRCAARGDVAYPLHRRREREGTNPRTGYVDARRRLLIKRPPRQNSPSEVDHSIAPNIGAMNLLLKNLEKKFNYLNPRLGRPTGLSRPAVT